MLRAGSRLVGEIIGIPAAERIAFAACEAAEQTAPITPTTPASANVCAPVVAVSPLQPESASIISKFPPIAFRSATAMAAA